MMYGTNIVSPDDKLTKVTEDYFYNSLVTPKPQMASAIKQLRTVYSLDIKKYNLLKKQLPYIVCGNFNPPHRKLINFAFTDSFILDFDHLSAKGLDMSAIRNRIQQDDRVVMCFSSPSEDGLKVLFHLKERCYDKGLYSIFYKAFAARFSASLELDQVIDDRTSDVSRACFISADPMAYYNRNAEAVDINSFVNVDEPSSISDLLKELKEANTHTPKEENVSESSHKEPDDDIMAKIRQTLNPKARVKPKDVYVPERLKSIISDLVEYVRNTGISVTEIIDIQYGKKIKASIGTKNAEVNVFYGQKGFSTVISPRRGTDNEANELLRLAIESFLAESEL